MMDLRGRAVRTSAFQDPEGQSFKAGDKVFGHVVETARTSFVLEIKSAGKVRSHSLVKIPGSRYQ